MYLTTIRKTVRLLICVRITDNNLFRFLPTLECLANKNLKIFAGTLRPIDNILRY